MKYKMNHRICYSEIGADHLVNISQIVRYFQNCSTFQSEDIGRGVHLLETEHRAWLLLSWQIIVDRYPAFGEEISVETWAYDWKKFYGYRNFCIKDRDEHQIAYANSIWIYTNTDTMLPDELDPKDLEAYGSEPRIEMKYAPRKIRVPRNYEEKTPFPIIRAHIDTNHHVNNAQYIELAGEFLPEHYEIYQMRAEYKHAAVLHDRIYPRVSAESDRYVVQLCNENGVPYVIVEFKEKEQEQSE